MPVRTARASVRLNLTALPQGPVTVRIRAVAGPSLGRSTPTYFQLYHAGGSPPRSRPTPGHRTRWQSPRLRRGVQPAHLPLHGRSKPRSGLSCRASRNTGGPPSSGKRSSPIQPEGSTISALSIAATYGWPFCPTLGDIATPTRGAGAISGQSSRSARPGGSGFAARYGHFEARILAPASPGTWPALWLLPSDNLIEPKSTVAEIDAVELYGHDPRGACHTTHSYFNGRNVGRDRAVRSAASHRPGGHAMARLWGHR